jgi:thiamine monophosphate synthase
VHAPEEAAAIIGERGGGGGVGLDYLYGGTVFATPSHPGEAGFGARGLAELVGAAGDVPVLAIGGIREDRIPELLDTGAHGVAVVRAVWHAERVGDAVQNLLDRLREAGRPQGSGRSGSFPGGDVNASRVG